MLDDVKRFQNLFQLITYNKMVIPEVDINLLLLNGTHFISWHTQYSRHFVY